MTPKRQHTELITESRWRQTESIPRGLLAQTVHLYSRSSLQNHPHSHEIDPRRRSKDIEQIPAIRLTLSSSGIG
ncbi:hypothetical protein KY285_005559 [Solanum tuberosum]|nr:hypothetical protein KY284_005766 [Solanum tuberosum]KAH0722996.1 hypothetical protein KY289_006040 [Solanum tuberosum]KAH0752411.1 hypothetical protein KY285_005559 [Solanum tuberosum]